MSSHHHDSDLEPTPSDSTESTDHRRIRRRRLIGRALGGMLLFSPLAIAYAKGKPRRAGGRNQSGDVAVAVPQLVKSDEEWRRLLTPEQFDVLRNAGTETAFQSRYHAHKGNGSYACVGCGNRVFHSSAKFDSGTGWPSFFKPVDSVAVVETPENSLVFRRIEISCSRCGGHLGHVFKDGPRPTGLRYCINSAALTFFADRLSS